MLLIINFGMEIEMHICSVLKSDFLSIIILSLLIVECSNDVYKTNIPKDVCDVNSIFLGQSVEEFERDSSFIKDNSVDIFEKKLESNSIFHVAICGYKDGYCDFIEFRRFFSANDTSVEYHASSIFGTCKKHYGNDYLVGGSMDTTIYDTRKELAILVWQIDSSTYISIIYTPSFRRKYVINQQITPLPLELRLVYSRRPIKPSFIDIFTSQSLGLE